MKRSYGVRKTIWVLWLFLSAFILFAAQGSGKKAEVFVEPSSVRTGENAYLVIRFKDESGTPSLSSLPAVPGLRWLQGISQSRRISIINGKRSSLYELRIPFLAEKAAAYSIPEIRLSNDVRTARITFTVQENTYTLPASAAGNHTGGKKNSSGKGGETLSLDQIRSFPFIWHFPETASFIIWARRSRWMSISMCWQVSSPDCPGRRSLSEKKAAQSSGITDSPIRRIRILRG